jgi:hypothetical protein
MLERTKRHDIQAGDNMVMLTNPEEVIHFVDVAPFSEDYDL